MAKFYGKIGYGSSVQSSPGVWEDEITEHYYSGDVIRNTRKLEDAAGVNPDILVGNSISIVSDEYANGHIFAMRYVEWMGALWIVLNVDVQSPRLILRLGGVYNGPKAPTP